MIYRSKLFCQLFIQASWECSVHRTDANASRLKKFPKVIIQLTDVRRLIEFLGVTVNL
jgi:hypothetical protein